VAEQTWDAEVYESNARFVSDLAMPVVELLDPQPGERILDLGCGDGVLTKKLEDMGCELVGIDGSPELVQAARRLGVDVNVEDAREMNFCGEFDAVFSNAVLHWIKDADRVIRNVFAALRPGGRFVAECGGHKCVETIHSALMGELERRGYDGRAASPWYFPSVEDYGERLSRAGFRVQYIEVIPRPTRLPGDISGFLETFGGSFTSVLPVADRRAYLADVRSRLKPLLCADDGIWTADYTRLRFKALKSG
jgi:trans-aconitate methyltransferase